MRIKPKISIIIIIFLTLCMKAYCAELSEISFKNSQNDWIEISLKTSLTNSIIVKEDSIITEIPPEKTKNKKFVLIFFKSPEEKIIENGEILEIYITKNGLTGTTEQITIEQNNQIIDAVCWKNSNPPKSEQSDMDLLNINCLNSDEISKNQSIAKVSGEWGILPHPTPGKENIQKNSSPLAKIDIQQGSTQGEIPFSINLTGANSSDPDDDELEYLWKFPDKTVEKENPPSYRFESAGTYTIALTVKDPYEASDTKSLTITASPKTSTQSKKSSTTSNGDLSTSIEITEIFPNPEGKDTGKEWIELYNYGNTSVNLSNWKINDKKLEPTTIQANSYLSIPHTLKNSKNNLSLTDFQGKEISKASYPTPKEGLSYAKISDKWFWANPTQSAKNPTYKTISATVITPPTIAKDFYFTILDEEKTEQKITFDQNLHSFELLSSLLRKETTLELTIDQNKNLIEYKILNTPQKKQAKETSYKWLPYIMIGISLLILILGYIKPPKINKP